MKTSATRTFMIWILSLATLFILVMWVYVLVKSYSYRAEAAATRNEIVATAGRDSYLSSVRSVLRGTEGDLASLEGRFIAEDGVPVFIEFLEGEAERFGVKADLGGISLDPARKGEAFRTLRVRINGSGSWRDLVTLVHSLDLSQYATRIDRAGFSKTAEGWNVALDISQTVK